MVGHDVRYDRHDIDLIRHIPHQHSVCVLGWLVLGLGRATNTGSTTHDWFLGGLCILRDWVPALVVNPPALALDTHPIKHTLKVPDRPR